MRAAFMYINYYVRSQRYLLKASLRGAGAGNESELDGYRPPALPPSLPSIPFILPLGLAPS